MRFGASTFIWTSPFGDEHLDLCQHVADLGFDVLEVCIEDPDRLTADLLRRAASEAGIEINVCGAFGPERDISHDDPRVREQAAVYLRLCIEVACAVGAPFVSGPMYSATGKTSLQPSESRARQREFAVAALRSAADYAAEVGIGLAIEPLNRFETDLVNTIEQGLELCELIDRENVGLLVDTFHMNIEEKDVGHALRSAGRRLFELHACENDRGTPGSGHVPWDDVFAALEEIDFDGLVVIESFTPEIKEIARAVSMWRPIAPSGDHLAQDGLRFLHDRHERIRRPAPATGSS